MSENEKALRTITVATIRGAMFGLILAVLIDIDVIPIRIVIHPDTVVNLILGWGYVGFLIALLAMMVSILRQSRYGYTGWDILVPSFDDTLNTVMLLPVSIGLVTCIQSLVDLNNLGNIPGIVFNIAGVHFLCVYGIVFLWTPIGLLRFIWRHINSFKQKHKRKTFYVG